MNDEHALSLCREIWPSFESGHLGVHFAWSIQHRVSLTYIFLRENTSWCACRKMAYLFSRRQGISYHLHMIWGPGSFILLLYWNWCSYRLEVGVSENLWIVVKDVKPLVVYDVECEMAMYSMKGKCASSWVDLGYNNLFYIPDVASVFFSCSDSVLGDSL